MHTDPCNFRLFLNAWEWKHSCERVPREGRKGGWKEGERGGNPKGSNAVCAWPLLIGTRAESKDLQHAMNTNALLCSLFTSSSIKIQSDLVSLSPSSCFCHLLSLRFIFSHLLVFFHVSTGLKIELVETTSMLTQQKHTHMKPFCAFSGTV